MPDLTLAQRLEPYGINPAKIKLPDLKVPAQRELVLQATDRKLKSQVVKLVPKSIEDVKRWVGIPNSAYEHVTATQPRLEAGLQSVMPVHNKYSRAENMTLFSLANTYVFGHSERVNAAQVPALNKWIEVSRPNIHVIFFNDINVGAGATLVVNYRVLFANHITIGAGGKIRMNVTQSGINCAGIKGA